MSDIERARVKAAAMRAAATPGRWGWRVREDRHWDVLETDHHEASDNFIGNIATDEDAELITTMLDPDVVDALDGMLAMAAASNHRPFIAAAERIASKFLAAADRVQA